MAIHARRFGFEFEFGGMSEAEVAVLVRDVLGGAERQVSRYEWEIQVAELGAFRVEADSRVFTEKAHSALREMTGEPVANHALDLLREMSRSVVPVEIVTPPLTEEDFPKLELLVGRLAEAGAWGAQGQVIAPFGFQINAEVDPIETEGVLAVLRAFLVLYEELAAETDLSRKLSGFIADFTPDLKLLVLDPEYAPSWEAWVRDFLARNPTRNRPLDLLPLLRHTNPDEVREALSPKEWSLVKPRPAYHYRLPDCRIGEEGWSVTLEVERWRRIEALASDRDTLLRMCGAYFSTMVGEPGISPGGVRQWFMS